jgi:hypothetical protein
MLQHHNRKGRTACFVGPPRSLFVHILRHTFDLIIVTNASKCYSCWKFCYRFTLLLCLDFARILKFPVPWTLSTPLPFFVTDTLWKYAVVFMWLAMSFEWMSHYIKPWYFSLTMKISVDILILNVYTFLRHSVYTLEYKKILYKCVLHIQS